MVYVLLLKGERKERKFYQEKRKTFEAFE